MPTCVYERICGGEREACRDQSRQSWGTASQPEKHARMRGILSQAIIERERERRHGGMQMGYGIQTQGPKKRKTVRGKRQRAEGERKGVEVGNERRRTGSNMPDIHEGTQRGQGGGGERKWRQNQAWRAFMREGARERERERDCG